MAGYTAAKRVQGREIMESAWIITFPTFGNKNHYLVFLVWKGTKTVPEFQRAHDLGSRRLSHKSIHWGRELPRDGDFGVYPTLGCTPYQIISSIPIFSLSPPKKCQEGRFYFSYRMFSIFVLSFNGNSRILKWRYYTIFWVIFCGDIPWNLGLTNRPKIYGIGSSNKTDPETAIEMIQSLATKSEVKSGLTWYSISISGSWNSHWLVGFQFFYH